ncbi:hypothetical protein EMPS_00018 [Entomortierella parvispora]|uniref:Senescence domain-containing protein n=1 Tax=Entomortierella parvispora TaxID=205924 RepID=A0A9P3LRD7_9FUNG|nr:hypothetical protein EMPS_00018 [Entomortierella parvispora]
MATPPASHDASAGSADPDQTATLIQIVLAIPNATIHQCPSSTAEKKKIGTGELRVYSTALPGTLLSAERTQAVTFMTLETNDTPTKSFKSLITHPLMPRSTAQKTGDRTWQFSVAGNGFLELALPDASDSDIAALENLLTDRIVYTNQYQLRNQLALVDDVGQVVGVLDKDEVDVEDDDTVSLHENQKSPVVVEAIEPKDDKEGEKLKLKISVPTADDMADYLTSASQYFGESLVKGATVVAGGIQSSSAYLNTKIPETQKPLKISPFIKNRVRNLTQVSRATFSVTNRLKSAIVTKAMNSGYRALKYWTAKDDPESYSTLQNIAYSILNSAGVLIQAAEESIGIVSAPAIAATQELTGRALGPDAKELITNALEGLKNFTLVYFDSTGVSRRAFLQTSRVAALQTAQEVRDGKIKMKQRSKNPSDHIQGISLPSVPLAATASAKASQVKELIFSYFVKDDGQDGAAAVAAGSSFSEGSPAKKKKTE